MLLEEIIQPESVLCNAQARSKKQCLEILSELLVRPIPEVAAEDIFESLIERERLGCTGLKMGVAFPHCRVDGLDRSWAAMIKLSEPVDFDSIDGEPVDIVFGMLVPAEMDDSHYADINLVTCILDDERLRARLRDCSTSAELHKTLLEGCGSIATQAPQAARAS